MNRLTVDKVMQAKLQNVDKPVEICDLSGHILGYFTPVVDSKLYKEVHSPTSESELQRRSQVDGGRPLAEILDDLEKQK